MGFIVVAPLGPESAHRLDSRHRFCRYRRHRLIGPKGTEGPRPQRGHNNAAHSKLAQLWVLELWVLDG
jgi:hypothetical protein